VGWLDARQQLQGRQRGAGDLPARITLDSHEGLPLPGGLRERFQPAQGFGAGNGQRHRQLVQGEGAAALARGEGEQGREGVPGFGRYLGQQSLAADAREPAPEQGYFGASCREGWGEAR
jgi:hypothetical protein